MNIEAKLEILQASKERIKTLNFGDPVTNICAGEGNPSRHCYFVEYHVNSRKNKFGITHRDYLAKCTDKKGRFWKTDIEVIYSGHLDKESCEKLFDPVWQAEYGS